MMTKILVVKSSVSGDASVSNRLVDRLVARLRKAHPGLEVIERDLDRDPIDHLRGTTLAGIGRGTPEMPAERRTAALSDELVDEVHAADAIVIGAPMYNFGISSGLKAWFDHVLRAGKTFVYEASGPKGLVTNKPVIVVETRGGLFSEGPMSSWDAQEPHLKALLSFIGISDVRVVRAEALAFGPDAAEAAITRAADALDGLEVTPLARAA